LTNTKTEQLADRVFDLAAIHGRVVLQQLGASEADAQLYGRLGQLHSLCRRIPPGREPLVLLKNTRGQSGLWAYGISGDCAHCAAADRRSFDDRAGKSN
jgi:cyclic beta-1,2-glucan synthetase